MIKINLLPHREEKRKQKKAAFLALMALCAIVGAVVVLLVGAYNARRVAVQTERNLVLTKANAALDKKIVEIAMLKQEIEALKARQQAVEDLQGDRNQPVYLLDELVKQTPDGVYLKAFKQDGQRVSMSGHAQSQERVSEFLRNLAGQSQWLERPELIEVRAATLEKSKVIRKVVEFIIIVGIKRARDQAGVELAGPGQARPGPASAGAALRLEAPP